MSAIYRVEERKCATCRYWDGARTLEFRADKAFAVRVEGMAAPCLAYRGQTRTPATCCSRWVKWEKLG